MHSMLSWNVDFKTPYRVLDPQAPHQDLHAHYLSVQINLWGPASGHSVTPFLAQRYRGPDTTVISTYQSE